MGRFRWSHVWWLLVAPALATLAASLSVRLLLDGPEERLVAGLIYLLAVFVMSATRIRADARAADGPAIMRDVDRPGGGLLVADPAYRQHLANTGMLIVAAIAAAASLLPSLIGSAIALAVVAVVTLSLPVRGLLRGTPGVVLSGDGVAVNGRRLAWSEIDRLGLAGDGASPVLVIGLVPADRKPSRRPWLRPYWSRRVSVTPRHAAVNLVYLMDLIEYYRTHPDRRGAIGRPGEQERLRQALHAIRTRHIIGPVPAHLP